MIAKHKNLLSLPKKNKNNGRSVFDILGDFGFFSHKKNNRTLIKVAT